MKVKTRKNLYLTKAEMKIISQFYDILNDDNDLDICDAWEIFLAVRDNDNTRAENYNYTIIITD